MPNQELTEGVRKEIEPFLMNQGIDLVEIKSYYEQGRTVFRILVDYPQGGISLNECVRLNRQISEFLDEKDIVNESYVLEVSSPGIDRPLKSKADFKRAIGKQITFFLNEPLNSKTQIAGIIKDVFDEAVLVAVSNDEITIPLINITKAKQVV